MGAYVINTKAEQQSMLESIGCSSYEDLIGQIPKEVRFSGELNIPKGQSEYSVQRFMTDISKANKQYDTIYRGVGAYHHYIPSIVKQVTSKEEFITAYTPYQAEISQGTLQGIFEYQTLIAELTGMDVSNASVYDGATATAEAVIMCLEKKRRKILISNTMNPNIIDVVKTLCDGTELEIVLIDEQYGATSMVHLKECIDTSVAGIIIQQPNYYGIIEDAEQIGILAKEYGAKYVIHSNPITLGVLKSPREYGADIAVGEGQSLGIPLSFGGPYLGFMATRKELVRKLPGRIAGETVDGNGNRSFVLTLQAREQHIRREKSTSNICSNQALCALTASVYLSTLGPSGLYKVGINCISKAHYLAQKLCELGVFQMTFTRDFFHEFTTTYLGDVNRLIRHLKNHNILAGYPLAGKYNKSIIWCVTEMVSKEEMDNLIHLIRKVDDNEADL